MLKEHVKVKSWGNSKAIRLPIAVTKMASVELEDELTVELDEHNNIVLKKMIEDAPMKELTIADLFKDYKGNSFKSDVQPLEAVGNELW